MENIKDTHNNNKDISPTKYTNEIKRLIEVKKNEKIEALEKITHELNGILGIQNNCLTECYISSNYLKEKNTNFFKAANNLKKVINLIKEKNLPNAAENKEAVKKLYALTKDALENVRGYETHLHSAIQAYEDFRDKRRQYSSLECEIEVGFTLDNRDSTRVKKIQTAVTALFKEFAYNKEWYEKIKKDFSIEQKNQLFLAAVISGKDKREVLEPWLGQKI